MSHQKTNPVHVAARQKETDTLSALLCSADAERLQSALAPEGNPPLMDTASSHNMYEINTLLKHEECFNTIDNTENAGNSVLHHGAVHKRVVSTLLKAGANPSIKNVDGKTPLKFAKAADAEDAARLLEAEQGPNTVT